MISAIRVIKTIRVGEGPTDIVLNRRTNKLYVANNRSDSVSVIDSGTNRVIATIKGVTDAATVAVNPFTNRIYVATAIGDTSRERVFVINGANNKIIANV
ncbi:YncE family protein [Paenibacillus elgii]|uniref:YncE family protein n=1 Tax=Paenibacillus elgii TaxID=189691 RepID=UPI00203CB972|nr:hypothetical protein [Paenibacillus elgii]MCM3272764.1 hypothetical protein [Paenibacillus elgii]